MSGFGHYVGDKTNRVRSGIILENSAPYAMAVQNAGYQVIPNGVGRYFQRSLSRMHLSAVPG